MSTLAAARSDTACDLKTSDRGSCCTYAPVVHKHTWNGRDPALARMYGFFRQGDLCFPRSEAGCRTADVY